MCVEKLRENDAKIHLRNKQPPTPLRFDVWALCEYIYWGLIRNFSINNDKNNNKIAEMTDRKYKHYFDALFCFSY